MAKVRKNKKLINFLLAVNSDEDVYPIVDKYFKRKDKRTGKRIRSWWEVGCYLRSLEQQGYLSDNECVELTQKAKVFLEKCGYKIST